MKICKHCNTEKPLNAFRVVKINKNGTNCYKSKCIDCSNKLEIEKYHNMTTEERKLRREKYDMGFNYYKNYKLSKYYGISLDEYNDMYKQQDGKCYICGKNMSGKEIKVDHDHITGKVRKLLCHNCNTSLGLLNENPDLFRKCEEYLKEHNCGNIS